MQSTRFLWLVGLWLLGGPSGPTLAEAASSRWAPDPKPRLCVLTDISNEPDDEESLVRLLVYANEFELEGLVATTSTWLRQTTRVDLIHRQLEAYAQVRSNLSQHVPDYPTVEALRAVTTTGQPAYGMAAVGDGQTSAGARLLRLAAARPDPRPLWVSVWGGANTLAQALWDARKELSTEELSTLVGRLRVYAISDQDDAGPWLRREFPTLFYIVSPSTPDWKEYCFATWTGISGDRHYQNGPGHHFELVDNPWLEEHVIRDHGPLGALYPRLAYIMEGDTPSFLGLINHGLGWHLSPAYGGWGGRYALYQRYGESRPIWSNNQDTRDTVTAANGQTVTSDQATIWRWREAYQHDFAARMDWCVAANRADANHNPVAILNGDTSRRVLELEVKSGGTVSLSAEGSRDPDGDRVRVSWFVYPEAGSFRGDVALAATAGERTSLVAPRVQRPETLHVILEVRDEGEPNLFTYRRAVLHVSPPDAAAVERPNILFCFADDWGRYAGAYAALDRRPSVNHIVQTPHLDRVAREGVLFRNAFVPAPSCTPCRSSILSGQYFFRTGRGAILQGATWDASIPSYPLLLKQAGYHIGKSYKVWSPGTPADAPYGGQQHAYEKAGRDFNNFSENATKLVREGLRFEEAKARLLSQVRANFEAFLADGPPGQPFCYWFGPTLTHRAYEKGSGQALWGIDPAALEGRLPRFLPDVPEVRADVADYLGEIQAWDAGVGTLLNVLEAHGQLDRTLVVISGDHGMPGVPGGKCNLYDFGVGVALLARGPGIKAGRIVDDFVNLMDLAPTFLEAGGVPPPAVMTGRSFLDVLRSERSGQVNPERTWVVTGRERHVAAARDDHRPYPQRALRTPDFLYIRNFAPDRWPMGTPNFTGESDLPAEAALQQSTYVAFADMDASPTKAWLVRQYGQPDWRWHYDRAFARRPGEELYDLRTDPDQAINLAGDAAYTEMRRELGERLSSVLKAAGDPRVTGDGLTFERPPFTNPQPSAMPRRAQPARSR